MTPLCKLAHKYNTDKGLDGHAYTQAYYQLLKDRADSVKRVLEVGILEGGSLRMWREFFPNATIFGIDNNKDYLINEDRIASILGHQGKPEELALVMGRTFDKHKFDIIIDDGAHRIDTQISTMNVLLPYLLDDGIYFVEDIRRSENVPEVKRAVPPWFDSLAYRSKWRHGTEYMLIIWNPDKLTPNFSGLGDLI